MENKKKIPCRVCGKSFEPCAYCQSHSEIFRWRNFACSKECAEKYMSETTEYRSLNQDIYEKDTSIEEIKNSNNDTPRTKTPKKGAKKVNNEVITE